MKDAIIEYLKTDRSFETGKQLYMKFGKSIGFKTTLNRQGNTDFTCKLLQEELRKLGGISEMQLKAMLSAPRAEKQAVAEITVSEEEKTIFRAQLPEQVRRGIRLRSEFPFLALPNCPDEFKILVHDMINAYESYVSSHKRLFDATTGEELQEVAAGVVENYITNRAIWDELNHYKATGQILGKHPIFSTTDRMKEIRNMTTAEHVKLQKSLMNNIARTRKNIADHPEHENNTKRRENVAQWEVELVEVNRQLGINA